MSSPTAGSTRRALILGGTGSLWDTVGEPSRGGWQVTVTGRDPSRLPPGAAGLGIDFVASDRGDQQALTELVGEGVDLLVDGQGYTPEHAGAVARLSHRCGATVYLSAKAVYVDSRGRHLNSPGGADWDSPVTEDTATITFTGQPFDSAEGYGANKAASEAVLLDEGARVSVLRPSKIHGPWVRQSRLRPIVEHARGGHGPLPVSAEALARIESTTSTVVLARAVLACARAPGMRVLNIADADPRPAGELASIVLRAAGAGDPRLVPIDDESAAVRLPTSLDMVLATDALRVLLGADPDSFADTAGREVAWLLGQEPAAADPD